MGYNQVITSFVATDGDLLTKRVAVSSKIMHQLFCGDALEILKTLPDASVQTCVTSPPYFGLRDYGMAGHIGLEETPDAFVQKLVAIFREVHRLLKEDGTLWLNLGDSYAGSWGNYSGKNRGAGRQRVIRNGSVVPNPAYDGHENWRPPTASKGLGNGIKPKDLIGIPWRVAFALQQDGWYLRQDIIWHKPNPMPESVTDRCTKAHEYIFLLSKSPTYYFDNEAIKEPAIYGSMDRLARAADGHKSNPSSLNNGIRPRDTRAGKGRIAYEGKRTLDTSGRNGQESFVSIAETRNKRSVWTVTTKPYKGAHFATFPTDLIEPCILAGSKVNDTVLDPFAGTFTTGFVAKSFGRHAIGIELNPEYLKLAEDRIMSIPEPMNFGEQKCSTSKPPITKNSKQLATKSPPVFETWSSVPFKNSNNEQDSSASL
jgi:DNA modification methylase